MKRKEILSIFAVILLLVVFILYTKPQEILNKNFTIELKYILLAIPFSLTAHTLMGTRYWYFLRGTNKEYHILDSISIHFITPILARITPGNIGEAKKVFNDRIRREDAIFTHVLERLTDFIILFIMGLGIFFILGLFEQLIYAFLLILLLLVFMIISLFNLDRIAEFLSARTSIKISVENRWMKKRLRMVDPRTLMVFLLISVSVWVVTIQIYSYLARSVGIFIDSLSLGIIIAATVLILSVSGLPGGFGIREITLTFFLVYWGTPLNNATIYSLLISGYLLVIETIFASISYLLRKIVLREYQSLKE